MGEFSRSRGGRFISGCFRAGIGEFSRLGDGRFRFLSWVGAGELRKLRGCWCICLVVGGGLDGTAAELVDGILDDGFARSTRSCPFNALLPPPPDDVAVDSFAAASNFFPETTRTDSLFWLSTVLLVRRRCSLVLFPPSL